MPEICRRALNALARDFSFQRKRDVAPIFIIIIFFATLASSVREMQRRMGARMMEGERKRVGQ